MSSKKENVDIKVDEAGEITKEEYAVLADLVGKVNVPVDQSPQFLVLKSKLVEKSK